MTWVPVTPNSLIIPRTSESLLISSDAYRLNTNVVRWRLDYDFEAYGLDLPALT